MWYNLNIIKILLKMKFCLRNALFVNYNFLQPQLNITVEHAEKGFAMNVPSVLCVFQKEDGIHLFVCAIFVIKDLVCSIYCY